MQHMAIYDEVTTLFMEGILGKEASEEHHSNDLLTQQALKVVKDVSNIKSPQDFAAKAIKRGLSLAIAGQNNDGNLTKESALNVFKYMSDRYGDTWYNWTPETIWQTLEYDGIDTSSDELRNMLQAFQVLSRTNFAHEDWHIFEKVNHALNCNHVHFGSIQPSELNDIAYTVKIMSKLRPGEEFMDDIKGYIAACAKESGVVYLPDDLFPNGCQEFLDKMDNNIQLKEQVMKAYPSPKTDINTALGVQLARLNEVRDGASNG
jgi:hypothetical protein